MNLWLDAPHAPYESSVPELMEQYKDRTKGQDLLYRGMVSHLDKGVGSILNMLKELGIDCLANAGTPRKLCAKLLGASSIGVVNVHPGLLPKYRGSCAVEWAILNNDRVGNTAHFMVEGYDAGPILTSETYDFNKYSTYSDIRCHVYKKQCSLVGKAFSLIQRDGLRAENCDLQDDSRAITRPPVSDKDMKKIHRLLKEGRYRFQY